MRENYYTASCAVFYVLFFRDIFALREQFARRCIWQPLYVQVQGHGVGALYVDLEGRFPLLRLVAILEERLRKAWASHPAKQANLFAEDCECFVHECLARFFVVRCSDYLNFLGTLISLDTFIQGMSYNTHCMIVHKWLREAYHCYVHSVAR